MPTIQFATSRTLIDHRTVSADDPLPVTGTIAGTVSENVTQWNGNTVDTNSGNKSAGTLRVTLATDQVALTNALKTDGSAVTQPVSAASLPLPTGAATLAKQPALGTAGTASADVISVQGIASMTALKVDGSAVTQPVSAASLPLPSGASTAAKQPALGTAGTASADVITVQGIASMTPMQVSQATAASLNATVVGTGTFATQSAQSGAWTVQPGNTANTTAWKVDGSAVTQPVDGATASGSAIANPPVTIGGRAATTNPTPVTDGQVVNAMLSKHGKLVTVDGAPRELRKSQKATLSNTTAETTIITAGAAGVMNDVHGLILANTGATTTKVDIRDATAGTIIATIEVPTGETRGFMLPAGSGIAQTTAANNWTAQCTAATTAMEVTALYIQTT